MSGIRVSAALTFATLAGFSCAANADERAGGFTPAEAKARMKLPEGFHAEVFASEPDIRQPVAGCFDERGRLWVIEYLQYPNPAGLKPVKVDQYLRTEYDKFPEPPPNGPKGADRIKILEDTDGDGKADKVKTFCEGLNLASGINVGHGGVFVAQAPYLLFYADKDRDDVPDGDPVVLLTGFGLQDAHATVNSLTWGPDGWLYGAQGSTVTAKIRGVEFQQGIWRYHPITKEFELFAEGGGNTWGLDFDRLGNAFGSSNGGYVAFHMVQGGYYVKGFAKHGPLHNPRSYGYFNPIEYIGPKHGGHVTPGGIIYKGDNFPEEFRGAFIGGNLLSNTVYWHKLAPKGSTFTLTHGGTLIDAKDKWFRPIDLVTGPDGALYVLDWYDQRASHLDPRDNWDRTNGRVYKIMYKDVKKLAPFDLAKWSSADLVALNDRENDWWPDMARRILSERRDPAIASALRQSIVREKDPTRALRELWALDVSAAIDDELTLELLQHELPAVRTWTVRIIGNRGKLSDRLRDELERQAVTTHDSAFRGQLASSCQRWPASDALGILLKLASDDLVVGDEHLPLQLWWATEKLMRTRSLEATPLARPESQNHPVIRDFLLERIARAAASNGGDSDLLMCAEMLDHAASPAARDKLIDGLERGFEGQRHERVPESLEPPIARLLATPRPSTTAIRLAIRLGYAPAYRLAVASLTNSKISENDRAALIEILGQIRNQNGLEALLALLRQTRSSSERGTILNALRGYSDLDTARAVLESYAELDDKNRDLARDIFCARKEWVAVLLDAIEKGQIPVKDVRLSQATRIAQWSDPTLTARIEKLWGRVPSPGSDAKKQRIAEVRGVLPEGDKGDPARGKPVFVKNCAGCHRLFGDGGAIGPDLSGAERGDLDFLLTSLVDPSAVIRKEYQGQTLALKDGRILLGLIIEETDKSLTLVDSQQQKTTIAKSEIEQMKPSDVSVMPEGQLDKMPDNEIRDLFRYLQSNPPTGGSRG